MTLPIFPVVCFVLSLLVFGAPRNFHKSMFASLLLCDAQLERRRRKAFRLVVTLTSKTRAKFVCVACVNN